MLANRPSFASAPARAEERPSFFQRKLARFLRRSSVAAAAVEEEASPTGPLVSSRSLLGVRAEPAGGRERAGSATATILDPEIVFSGARAAEHAAHGAASASGARSYNEDRFRVISDLELYVLSLLRAVGRASVRDVLEQRVIESCVLRGDAASIATRVSSAGMTLLLGGGGGPAAGKPCRTQLFGIYDGHGGARCSSLLALLFPLYLADSPQFAADPAAACSAASLAMNAEILARDGECEGGATALTLLLRSRTLFLSNTGDCRAVLLTRAAEDGGNGRLRRQPRVVQLTTDHKATDAEERKRVEAAGGMILFVKGVARVNGRLAVTRAFGDADMGDVVIPDPQVVVRALEPDDEYVVLASDGLWDVMTNEVVASTVRNHPWLSTPELAQVLVDRAVELGSLDNVTVIVVDVRTRAV